MKTKYEKIKPAIYKWRNKNMESYTAYNTNYYKENFAEINLKRHNRYLFIKEAERLRNILISLN